MTSGESEARSTSRRGRRAADEGWERLSRAIDAELSANYAAKPRRRPGTPAELAGRMLIRSEEVRNWISGAAKPRFAQLPTVAEALAAGYPAEQVADKTREILAAFVTALLTSAGDAESAAEKAFAVHCLQTRLLDLQAQTAVAAAGGVSAIIRRAQETKWAVGVWPSYEGPAAGPELHVVDRLDFRRLDGSAVTAADVQREFGDLLRPIGASPATSVWSSPRWVPYQGSRATCSGWVVPRVGAPHDSLLPTRWADLSSIAVIATTSQSWANDVASHIADAIGYGMTSTDDMLLDVYGLTQGDRSEKLNQLHDWLLDRPPARRVWSHYAYPRPLADIAGRHAIPPGLVVFWLHESDRHLQLDAELSATDPVTDEVDSEHYERALDRLRAAREQGDETAASLDPRFVRRLDIELPEMPGMSIEHQRRYRWEQCFEQARDATQFLLDEHHVPFRPLKAWWDKSVHPDVPANRATVIQQWVQGRVKAPRAASREVGQ